MLKVLLTSVAEQFPLHSCLSATEAVSQTCVALSEKTLLPVVEITYSFMIGLPKRLQEETLLFSL
jgi:hypothetical protein